MEDEIFLRNQQYVPAQLELIIFVCLSYVFLLCLYFNCPARNIYVRR
jgi:hypothetical protein